MLEFGDMVFYSIAGLVVIILLWLRFVEPHVGLWGACVVWLAWTAFLVSRYLKAKRRRAGSPKGLSARILESCSTETTVPVGPL